MLAIISDLHSNVEAISAVMDHIRKQQVDEIVCLGDVIGYGPCPEEAVRVAMENCTFTLTGNHEWAVLNEALGFNVVAREAVDWTRKTLMPKWYSSGEKKRAWEWLKSLQLTETRGKFLFVHASPTHPTEEYLLRSDVDEILHELSPKLRRAFEKIRWVCFVGHTHYPGVITEDGEFFAPKEIDHVYKLREGKRCVINVGSVGQPRDSDNRSCYITLDRGTIRWHRVEYDVEATYKRVLSNGALDRSLGERLLSGT